MAENPMSPPTPSLSPYMTIDGASEAIELYKKAFLATELMRMPAQDGRRLMHASLMICGGLLMMSDDFPEHCGGVSLAPSPERPAAVSISLRYATPAEVDTTFERAVGAGCIATAKPEDAFWGDRFAMLTDPFGHRWMLVAALQK